MQAATRILVSLAILALAPSPSPALAADSGPSVKWYDIEILVFRHSRPRSDETWPLDQGLPEVSGLQPLFPAASDRRSALRGLDLEIPAGAPLPFSMLPEDELTLRNAADALRRSSRYSVVLHAAWTQPSLAREASPAIRLSLPGSLDEAGEEESAPANNRFGDEFSMRDADIEDRIASDSRFARPLDGFARIGVGRYLHVELDLLYLPSDINPEIIEGSIPDDPEFLQQRADERESRRRDVMEALARGDITMEEADILMLEPEETVFHGFRINALRRVRSGELHYFDHPVFGVLVTANPREIPLRN